MSLTKEDLSAISELLQPLKNEMQNFTAEMHGLKDNVHNLNDDVHDLKNNAHGLENDVLGLKNDVHGLKDDMQNIDARTAHIELILENEINKNIQLLAENHITLIDKLNQSIKVADKTLMFEVQMTSLTSRIEHLGKEVAEIKESIFNALL